MDGVGGRVVADWTFIVGWWSGDWGEVVEEVGAGGEGGAVGGWAEVDI